MSVKQISAPEVHAAMTGSGTVTYVDVRTPKEFESGHPPKAINIPVVFPNPATRRMEPNPDFMDVIRAHVPVDRRVIVGCQMGGRSQLAAELLVQAGYSDVANMQGGFGGARDPVGQIVVSGWIQHEFPVETEVPAGAAYADLRQEA
jgi:rhodanese-related sulfurtransferase